MTTFIFEGTHLSHQQDETVLDAALRKGVAINYSCKKGVCKGCVCRAANKSSQLYVTPLPSELVEKGYFLPCMTPAYEGLDVQKPDESDLVGTPGITVQPSSVDPRSIEPSASRIRDINDDPVPGSRLERPWPAPCPALWRALQQNGDTLKGIIDEFYDAVFEDDLLSPYFQKSTKQRSKEKVYSFYKQLFSGEKCYFGDRPHNAHHWMIIPDDIYDHRLKLLQHFMNSHGLSKEQQALWLPYEEYYRQDIVKSQPLGRWIGNVYQPPGGLAYERLDEGTFCDTCAEFFDKGVTVLFETRTGKVYCNSCHSTPRGA